MTSILYVKAFCYLFYHPMWQENPYLADKETLPDAVLSAAHNAVADNLPDYLRDLRDCRGDSLLEELDDLNVEES